MYNAPDCKPWTSRHWAPPGFSSRSEFAEHIKASRAQARARGRREGGRRVVLDGRCRLGMPDLLLLWLLMAGHLFATPSAYHQSGLAFTAAR